MIHVTGHLNPDSDAICTAFMAARWLNMRGLQATAWRLGEPNRETRFLFGRAGLALPPLLEMPLTDQDVWLVDFTEPTQGPETLLASNIVGIIDHHRLGGLVTRLPPEVWIKPVGSSAALLWQLMSQENRAQITPAQALLLLGAILSDTVTLRSPTTTADDRLAVEELTTLAGIDLTTFSADLLSAKTSVEGLSASELLQKDIKLFTINGQQVSVAQIELYALSQVACMMDDLRQEMTDYATRSGADLVVLMLTDINAGNSQLWFAGARQPGLAQPVTVEGMLSRKKQMLPWLESHVAQTD
ncbi:manganese-dependent inorganic pyrophosphatase [Citrobacter farmeri]|uniref:manganese-dependent inorganic pyrophosphatase n=1 Tax=Citrobacter farmeri TaxID=67824 RepID=UPI00189E1676|nr:manganese-dependent inorganic pyrophosphatase [Citrobacter farmeri]EHK0945019.1 manganese-dependent inorganic pyrophosphatase [Citrobacter farmeri]EKX4541022.1 manganese-dependent inorganic pyrophosphatase [Citrobacter farmeri]MDB2163356.1 manganese-dependent inorganic pyrophosphatase [Citrobacter farmeri]HBC0357570.1 manganese-dependent inorganic pyrophosphatase [Citrobacter farmeri]HBZ8834672.1 manganese-dependent inorganic pyrophosphatase [Citrobacter farmeri]